MAKHMVSFAKCSMSFGKIYSTAAESTVLQMPIKSSLLCQNFLFFLLVTFPISVLKIFFHNCGFSYYF